MLWRGQERDVYFFHQAVLFELVNVGQTADKCAFSLFADAQVSWERLWTAEGAVNQRGVVRFDNLALLCRSAARPSFVGFPIQKEITEYAAWTPVETIGPPLDPALVLVENEDGAGCDHLAFGVDEATGYARDQAPASGLEDEQGIARGLYPAGPGRL